MGLSGRALLALVCMGALLWQPVAAKGEGRFSDAVPSVVQAELGAVEPLWEPKRWAVDPKKGLLSVLLPISPSPEELRYVRNQLRTFAHFFDHTTVHSFVIVSPPKQVAVMEDFLTRELAPRGGIQLPRSLFRLATDSNCVRNISADFAAVWRHEFVKHVVSPGWVLQQLVKLSCAPLFATPFFLVLDADVFFTRRAAAADLFVRSKCLKDSLVCDTTGTWQYTARNDMSRLQDRDEEQQAWLTNSAQALQLEVPMDGQWGLGVTPQILATDVLLQLCRFIGLRFHRSSCERYLLELHHQSAYRSLKDPLPDKPPWRPSWTEYDLYWIFAAHTGMLERLHAPDTFLMREAVWGPKQYEKWDPCRTTFRRDGRAGWMSLVQSNVHADGDEIWRRIEGCLNRPRSWLHQLRNSGVRGSEVPL